MTGPLTEVPAGPARPPTSRRPRRAIDGVVLLDKPVGITANAALQRVKWLYQAAKAGHTGSLDPLASGMLPICLGEATKLAGYLLGADKAYEVQACFGARTATGDADGEVVERSESNTVSRPALEAAITRFLGDTLQVPPMYSALKHEGRRLYALARAGEEVPREPRPIHLREFAIVHYDPRCPILRVHCTKGTYVRTLIEDLACAAGTLGHVIGLRRLWVEPFATDAMVTLEGLEADAAQGLAALDQHLLPMDRALSGWPAVELGPQETFYLLRGNPVTVSGTRPVPGLVRVYGPGHRFLGVGELLAEGLVAPRRLMTGRDPAAPV